MKPFFVVLFVLRFYGLSAFSTDEPKVYQIEENKLNILEVLRDDYTEELPEDLLVPNTKGVTYYDLIERDDDSKEAEDKERSPLESWSVVWYIASFGGLIAFFLVVSCSEWCCRRNARRNCQRNSTESNVTVVSDNPPPSYDQFAPPPYESLCYGRNGEKSEFDIYVVPVDAMGTIMNRETVDDSPPSYVMANEGRVPAYASASLQDVITVPVHTARSKPSDVVT
ncbi:uncharacterized protein LOC109597641 [Aethina tumida]|uniref:uncharacterized protein LOC109597641 n=1 Tax=Aethina tumida TaxID=116153 RepID=UPI00096B12C0|nr:uncharacterized protein LOC109597641 [Aethina tumida]